MGGTSTDVSHFDGEYERAFETEVAGVRMRAPMMLIHTVAAGGGSILHFDGARFRVGPDSRRRQSRAELLPPRRTARRHRRQRDGRQADAGFLPEDLRPGAGPAARRRRGARRPSPRSPRRSAARSPEEVADGFIKIAVENMANAIKKISVQRGYDVTRYALNCFGGAGGQHACLVADALGMTKVLIHPFSSLLSAYGMGLADIRATRQQAIEEPLGAKALAALKREGGRLGKDAKAEVAGQGVPAGQHQGASSAPTSATPAPTPPLVVDAGTLATMKSAFEKAHKARFGFIDRSKQLVIEAVSVEAVGGGAKFRERSAQDHARASSPRPPARTRVLLRRQMAQRRGLHPRPAHARRTRCNGPAIVIEPHQTIVVEPGWRAAITAKNHLVLTRIVTLQRARARSAPRPIRSCSRCSTTCSCRSPSRWA